MQLSKAKYRAWLRAMKRTETEEELLSKLQGRRSRSGTGKELPHSHVLLVTVSLCQRWFKSYRHWCISKFISVGQLHLTLSDAQGQSWFRMHPI